MDCSLHLAGADFSRIFGPPKTKGSCCFGFVGSLLHIVKTTRVDLVYEWVWEETAILHCKPVRPNMASVVGMAVGGDWTSRVLYGVLP